MNDDPRAEAATGIDPRPALPDHRFMIEPHSSTRYAVVFGDAIAPGTDGYVVCAVHAFADDGCSLVSEVRPHSEADVLSFHPPQWVGRGAVIRLAANSKAAYRVKAAMVEEDFRAETEVVAP